MNTGEIPLARGYFEKINHVDNKLQIQGWMFRSVLNLKKGFFPRKSADCGLDKILIILSNDKIYQTNAIDRKDVRQVFSSIEKANQSGFYIEIPLSEKDAYETNTISAVGIRGGENVCRMDTWYSKKWVLNTSVPATLMKRVANTENNGFFIASSYKSFYDYFNLLRKHIPVNEIHRMLDWGCGCGRLIMTLARATGIPEICGCDVDEEAIEWCRLTYANQPNLKFSIVPFNPPTAYKSESFDVVLANSVLTHLSKKSQMDWLSEISRILKPGGFFIASIHGESATFYNFGTDPGNILQSGIFDENMDDNLKGIAPEGYYRGTFQSREYTENTYGDFFKIREYVKMGSMNFQDMVLMQKD